MIDIKKFREDPHAFAKAAADKNVEIDVSHILDLDRAVRALKGDMEQIASEKNAASDQIATASDSDKKTMIEEMRIVGRKEDDLKAEFAPKQEELTELLYRIPNPALEDVTVSASEDDNEVVRTVGEKPMFSFTPKDHVELGEALGIIDIKSAAEASGARFTYLKGDGVFLQLALQQYALSIAKKFGHEPIIVPNLVRARSMRAMGYLEHGGHDEIYYLSKDNLYLIGTSEQALGPMYFDKTFSESDLPLRSVGISPCYRREAGSYGKDTKGILRLHQFDKVEFFSVTTPEESEAEHERILEMEEELMTGLGLHYQVIKMVTGDLGLPAARKYDIEAWLPTQDTFRETHSCSTTTDFQARRLNTKFKTKEGKVQHVHMLNGTAFAMGRTILSILENFQLEDGRIAIPSVLQPFMSGQTHIEAK
jgi:seryl-tRNA synthetase